MRRRFSWSASGDSILLPPELVFSGDPLGCLTCYASSEEDQTDRGAPAASADQAPAPPGVAAWSDPTDEHAVRQLISAHTSQTQAAESLERALMAREDPVRVALEVIQAERRAACEPVAPSTRTKVIPAVKPMPRVGVKAMPRIPDQASRTFPKGIQHGYSYVSGPSPSSWTRTPTRTRLGRGPAPQPAAVPAATRVPGHGRPFDRLFPVPGQSTPYSHDATGHLECAFQAAPTYARASAQVVIFSHHSRPTSPRSSQALICPQLSDQKALERLSLPCLSGVFISFSLMRLHLICSIQSASIFHTCQPAQVEIPCSGLSFALPVFLHPSLSS